LNNIKNIIVDGLTEVLAKVENTDSINDSTVLADVGLDSLGVVNLILFLDERLDMDIYSFDYNMADFNTLDSACNCVSEHLKIKDTL